MGVESTFVMVKPDGVRRGLIGEVISRFEKKGLQLTRARMLTIDEDLARRHYEAHLDKPFFPDLLAFITSGPVLAMEWTGEDAIKTARNLMGDTNPLDAKPGTIRGDFALVMTENIVHGSDEEPGSAKRELGLFFG